MERPQRSGKPALDLAKVSIAAILAILLVAGVLAIRNARTIEDELPAQSPSQAAEIDSDDDAKALGMGTSARIGPNYDVAVTDVTHYTSSAADFLVVTIKARYLGKNSGELWADLDVEYFGPGSQAGGESDCRVDLGTLDSEELGPLDTGESQSYAVCIDLPSTDLDRGKVSIQEAFSERARTYWSTGGAKTESAPTSVPSAAPSTAPATRAPQQAVARPTWTDQQQEALEIYEKQKRYLDKTIEAIKNADDYDEDDLEDYEDWRDDVRAEIRKLKALKEQAGE